MGGPRGSGLRAGDGVVVRTPLLPLDTLTKWAADPRGTLDALLARPDVAEAIYVASPGLAAAARTPAVDRALAKYVARMCGRATPFGLCAAISTGRLGKATAIRLAPRAEQRRRTRLDNDYLFVLAAAIAATPEARAALRYRPSSSLYRTGGRIRYAAARVEGEDRSYHLVSVEPTPYLDATLDRARDGASLEALAAALVDDEITLEDARGYVGELVDAQLLVPALGVQITGPEPLDAMIAQLDAAGLDATVLREVRAALVALDAGGVGQPPDRYRAIAAALGALPAKIEPSRLFQVDAVTPADATVGVRVAADVARAIEVLRGIVWRPDTTSLDDFQKAFAARYEDREVPLAEVLDEESGIGFEAATGPGAEGAPLLAGLAFPGTRARGRVPWGAAEAHLLRRLADHRGDELVLDDADLAAMKSSAPPGLPDALSAVVRLAGDDVLFDGAGGPSGARVLGRFCHASPDVDAIVRAHLAAEEALRPGAVFAEIVHLNEGRIGNILCRPVLRGYELAYLGMSGAPDDRQLALDDLTVSVRGGRIVLWSRRLDREVVPRLTTAHNFRLRSLGVYRFLCALASQDGDGVAWSWGALGDAPFLPRVRHGRVILARATWNLAAAELKGLRDPAAVAALRARRALPRFVVIAEGDNELPIDLDNPLLVDVLIDELGGASRAVLRELWPAPDRLDITGPDGAYTHELVITFVRQGAPAPAFAPRVAPSIARRFPPGSDWLYAKLYCGASTADRVLREVVAPVVREHPRWFFLRYGDPDHHVRLRIAGGLAALPALAAAAQPLLDAGALHRIQLDTYEREVERYGGDAGIEACEEVFAIDSAAVLAIVELLDGDAGHDARWRLALRGIDGLLTALGADAPAVVNRGRDALFAEHHGDGDFGGRLSARFARERASLEALFTAGDDHPLEPGLAILARRDAALAPLGERLRRPEVSPALDELAWSLAHMHANRLLHASQRAQELVLYDFLRRIYASRKARAR